MNYIRSLLPSSSSSLSTSPPASASSSPLPAHMAEKERIYTHPTQKDVALPNLDLLSLLFDSEHSVAQDDTILHTEAANAYNRLTKRDLRDLTEQIAHGLRTHYSIGSNGPNQDVVTVISYGQILIPAALFGVIAAGGVYSAASPSSTVSELQRQIEVANSRLVICGEEHKEVAKKAATQAGVPLENVLLLESYGGSWSLISLGASTNAISSKRLAWQKITDPKALKESLIVILWSSGTTGLPKGVMLSHLNLVAETWITSISPRAWVAQQIADGTYVEPTKQGQTLAHLPISHIAGLFGYPILPMYNGMNVVWMRKYVWQDMLEFLKQYPITAWYTVPSIWLRISKSPEISGLLSGLEGASTGAAPMDGELMKAVNKKVADGKKKLIGQTWGLTETTGAVTAMPKDDSDDTGCLGRILPGVELRMVDENYNDVDPATQEGELIVRSPLVTNGYYNNPQATKDAFHGDWFCSGDIAAMRDGKFYIVDRKKELLKYKGLQVAPAEIENLLFQHPQIQEAAVVGLPAANDPGTDLPRAYVVPSEGSKVTEDDVKKFVADNLAEYKQLRGGVVFVDELPKNAIGKYLRRELRDRAKKEAGQGPQAKL